MNATLLLLLPLAAGNPPCKAEPIPPHFQTGLPYPPPDCPPGVPCPPIGPPAPLLAARVIAPEGVKVSVQPGAPDATRYAVPTTFGFRPGYVYRLELTDIPGHPGEALYPVLEVRGSLVPRAGHEATWTTRPRSSSTGTTSPRRSSGGLVTKVIYLEDPTQGDPGRDEAGPADRVHRPDGRGSDQVGHGERPAGRDAAVRRPQAGRRTSWRSSSIPGTVLLPGEQHLGGAGVPAGVAVVRHPAVRPDPRAEATRTRSASPTAATPARGWASAPTGPARRAEPDRRGAGVHPPRPAAGDDLERGVHLRAAVRDPAGGRGPGGPAGGRRAGLAAPDRRRGGGDQPDRRSARWPTGSSRSSSSPGCGRRSWSASRGCTRSSACRRPEIVATAAGVRVVSTAVAPEEITNYQRPDRDQGGRAVRPGEDRRRGDDSRSATATARGRRSSELVVSDSLSGRLEYVAGSAAVGPAGERDHRGERGRLGGGAVRDSRVRCRRGRAGIGEVQGAGAIEPRGVSRSPRTAVALGLTPRG